MKKVYIFFNIFYSMDNRKGEKGKLFFTKYFISIYNNKIYFSMYNVVIELVMDNEKGEYFNQKYIYIEYNLKYNL